MKSNANTCVNTHKVLPILLVASKEVSKHLLHTTVAHVYRITFKQYQYLNINNPANYQGTCSEGKGRYGSFR